MAAKGGTHEMLATCTYQCESFYQGVMYGCVFAIASVQLLRIRSRSTELTAQLLVRIERPVASTCMVAHVPSGHASLRCALPVVTWRTCGVPPALTSVRAMPSGGCAGVCAVPRVHIAVHAE